MPHVHKWETSRNHIACRSMTWAAGASLWTSVCFCVLVLTSGCWAWCTLYVSCVGPNSICAGVEWHEVVTGITAPKSSPEMVHPDLCTSCQTFSQHGSYLAFKVREVIATY